MEKGLKTKTQVAKDFDLPINTLSAWLFKTDDYITGKPMSLWSPEQEDEELRTSKMWMMPCMPG